MYLSSKLNHRVNFGLVLISRIIQDLHAPYCQRNVTIFGENAGQQCVAMSLCALIYSKINS